MRQPSPCAALLLSLALTHALALPGKPWLSSRFAAHRELLESARQLQRERSAAGGLEAPSDAEPPAAAVEWPRLWRELRATQQARSVVPASLLSLLLTASELLAPRLRGQLFDQALVPGATLAAMAPRLRLLALLALLGWLLNIAASTLFASARWSASMAGRVRLMDAVLSQEPQFFDGQQPGELNSRLLSEPERLQDLANRGPERCLTALLAVAGGLALMLATDWRLGLLALALRAPLIGVLAEAAGRTVGLFGVLQQHALNDANSVAAEALAQPHAVAAQAAHRSVLGRYTSKVEAYMEVIKATLLSETVLRFTRLGVDGLTDLLLLGYGLLAVTRRRLSLGALTAFYAYSSTFAEGCSALQSLLNTVHTIRPACSRYFELLDRAPRMSWHGGAIPDAPAAGAALELRGASVAFPGRSGRALANVSLAIKAGEVLAIVGPSGAGKSTLLRLLNRLYDVTEGEVLLDGADVRSLDLAWLRGQSGHVPQDALLFDASVADNVAFGPPEGAPSRQVVERAIDDAGAAEFVAALPRGADTVLGEGGRRLSGGQRQRLAIARALARSPRVLLWDEATSNLDGTTERLVHATLRAQRQRRTVVLVAHRLSSVLCADRVAVLRHGRLEELGTPDELATGGGWFQENFYPTA